MLDRLSPRGIRIRLFLTCWIVFSLHFATDFVREHYLVVSIVEDHSYRLDRFYGLHVDIFQNPPHAKVQGAHHGANPGISMLAAVPYFLLRPAVDAVVRTELARRSPADTTALYRDDRPRRVEFYRQVRQRGLDIRFGLVAAITLVFCMAPLSAGGVVLLHAVLERLRFPRGQALGFALLYAFATPVLFRTAYLNQNLALGIAAFTAFVLIWNPGDLVSWPLRRRYGLAGLLGGFAFLCDYSGAILMGLVGGYAWWRRTDDVPAGPAFRDALWYALGTVPGILLLWQYQWASFGNPFLPPQHWMAPVEWIEVGYQGVGGFVPELFRMLLIDPRFGLAVTAPLLALGFAGPWAARSERSPVPFRETLAATGISLALVIFFSTVQYTRLQWVTGIRYLAAIFPFLFLAAVPLLVRLPRALFAALAVSSAAVSWSLAMVRHQGTVLDNLERVFLGGFQLPWLTVLSKLSTQYTPWLAQVSPLPLFVLAGAVIYLIWRLETPWRPVGR
jgi:hypothetical protein